MKFAKLFLIIASLITVSNSYAGWSKELSVKGSGTVSGKTADFNEMRYFPSAGYYSGKLQVIVEWQQNALGLYAGDGLSSAQVDFYSLGVRVESSNLLYQEGLGRQDILFSSSVIADSFRPRMHVWVLGWRKGLSRVWLYY